MMYNAVTFATSLDRAWRQRKYNARQTPWHLCILPLMGGILAGDAWGSEYTQSANQGFELIWGGGLILILCLCLFGLGGLWLRTRKHAHHIPNKFMVGFTLFWGMLWFVSGVWLGCPTKTHTPPVGELCQIEAVVAHVEPGTSQISAQIMAWTCPNGEGKGKVDVRMTMMPEELSIQGNSPVIFRDMKFRTKGRFELYQAPDAPGMFNAKAWAHAAGYAGLFKRSRVHGKDDGLAPIHILSNEMGVRAKLETWRRITYQKLTEVSPSGIMPALVLGCSRDIADDTRLAFGRLGIAHVLAVSGLHFGLIAMAMHFLLAQMIGYLPSIMRRFGKKRAALAVSLPILILYLFFVGAPISAQRALLMVAVSTLARLFYRKANRTRALCIAGILILLHDPLAVFSISFQLSFSAVLGIIWGSDFYDHAIKMRVNDWEMPSFIAKLTSTLLSTAIMTLSTSLTTAPFVLWHFGQLPIMGTLTNLIVIPYVSFVLMPLAIFTTFALTLTLPFTNILVQIAQISERCLVTFAQWADQYMPLNCIDVPPQGWICVLAALTAVGVLYRLKLTPVRLSIATITALLMALVLAMTQIAPRWGHQTDDLRITFVAMGQADATLIEFPNGHVMLIDAGAELNRPQNSTQQRLLPYLRSQGIRHIDTLVLTHSDYDHTAGIPHLLQHISVGQIWHNGFPPHDTPDFWSHLLPHYAQQMHDASRLSAHQPQGDVQVEILWPRANSSDILADQNMLNANEMSIVLRLQYGHFSALFMGDAGTPTEQHLLINQSPLTRTTVLKVGHHGSKSASSEAWIRHTQPQIAVFSVGKHNQYKFPHISVQKRFQQAKSKIFRTDRHGTVQIQTDGQHYKMHTMHR